MGKLVFIIAHRYVRGYRSFLEYYLDKINEFYPDSLVIVVDNNSPHKVDVFNTINKLDNHIFLDNNGKGACKFELGAYQVGFEYLIKNDLIKDYSYVTCVQDTFVLKNKFNFNTLKLNNVHGCSLTSWTNDWAKSDVWVPILNKLKLTDKLQESRLCWCNSFIVSTEKLNQLYDYFKQINITTRHESEGSERYLGRLLSELNGGFNYDIDGDIDQLDYYCHSVQLESETKSYFCKISQQKNEKTYE